MKEELPYHPNGIRYTATDKNNELLFQEEYYSVGGGIVIAVHPYQHNAYRYLTEEAPDLDSHDAAPPYMFDTAGMCVYIAYGIIHMVDCISYIDLLHSLITEELLRFGRALDCPISEVTLRNEMYWRTEEEITQKLLEIWKVMDQSIENGINTKGLLKTKAKRR